jgi:Fic family protein
MHPFLDGNGRTARAVEALLLQRCGLRDTLFIAMSNYYYDEKNAYLKALSDVRANDHDLTPFLVFGLKGIEQQCMRLIAEIRRELAKVLFRDRMFDLFYRMETPRSRFIAERQVKILTFLLERNMSFKELLAAMATSYLSLKNPLKAFVRDIDKLETLQAIKVEESGADDSIVSVRLEWPMEITETEFFKLIKRMPKSKMFTFLDH